MLVLKYNMYIHSQIVDVAHIQYETNGKHTCIEINVIGHACWTEALLLYLCINRLEMTQGVISQVSCEEWGTRKWVASQLSSHH